jgi:hypothetical protein
MTSASPSFSPRLQLLGVACLCLVLTYAANSALGYTLHTISQVASSCIASAVASFVVYLGIRPKRPFAWALPSTAWNPIFRLSGLWLCAWLGGAVCVGIFHGAWQAYAIGFFPVVGFVIFGPITEEFLLRGAVFELTERSFPTSTWAPIVVSTLLFSAYHLQIHAFRITPFVLLQLGFTLPLGYVLARVRALCGSVWPGLILHVLTNLPFAMGAPPGVA